MKNFQWAGILVMTLALVFGPVQVSPAAGLVRGPGGGGPGYPPVGAADVKIPPSPLMSLGLSDQQLTRIREMRQNTYNQTRNLRIRIMDTQFALSQLKLQKNVDQAAVNAKIKELQDLHSQVKNYRLQARQQLQSILTPDQWSKLKESTGKGRHQGRGPYAGATRT